MSGVGAKTMGISSSSYDDNLQPIQGQLFYQAIPKTVQLDSPGNPAWLAYTRSERRNVHFLPFRGIGTKLYFDWLFLTVPS